MEPMKNKKIIIAGPCSISSKKELDDTFINIYDKVDFLDAEFGKLGLILINSKELEKKEFVMAIYA